MRVADGDRFSPSDDIEDAIPSGFQSIYWVETKRSKDGRNGLVSPSLARIPILTNVLALGT
jgi:hypothetical protein